MNDFIATGKYWLYSRISKNTMYTWTRAQRLGYLDLGCGTQTPQSALSLHEELVQLRAYEYSAALSCGANLLPML